MTASNRINLPDVAARLIEQGAADLVSMARPLLADADFAAKAEEGRADRITVCIACNQACLDHYFTGQVISCLVNPRAVRETQFADGAAGRVKRVAVIGGGVAGIAAALEAARRGHAVTLYEAAHDIGGQLTLAAQVPGKEDYGWRSPSFRKQLADAGVEVRTGRRIDADALRRENFDDVVISTGIEPRPLDIPGADDPRVVGYTSILDGSVTAGHSVVIVGGGGIGHDVALYLAHAVDGERQTLARFRAAMGHQRRAQPPVAKRSVTMVKRSPGPFGRTLGKSTGWILRQELKDLGVRQIAGASYLKIDDAGCTSRSTAALEVLGADTIVVCAGQLSARSLADGSKRRARLCMSSAAPSWLPNSTPSAPCTRARSSATGFERASPS